MITSAICKKYNGLEFPFALYWMSIPINCVILLDKKIKGGSIKPYYKDENERETFIFDFMKKFYYSRSFTENHISSPTFCLMEIRDDLRSYDITKIIKSQGKYLKQLHFETLFNPQCPLA